MAEVHVPERRPALVNGYLRIGRVLGAISGGLAFVTAWGYCILHYGFLVGVSLGWIPALICAAVAGFAALYLWGLLVLAGIAFGAHHLSYRPQEITELSSDREVATDAAAVIARPFAGDPPGDVAPPPPDSDAVRNVIDEFDVIYMGDGISFRTAAVRI